MPPRLQSLRQMYQRNPVRGAITAGGLSYLGGTYLPQYIQHQQQQQQQNARNFERHREYLRGLKPTAKPKILDEKSTLGDMVNAVNRLSVGFSELENKKLRGFGVLPIHGMSEDPFKQILTSRKE